MRKMLFRLFAVFLCAASFITPATVTPAAPARAEGDKPYVVLALSGGGVKGYAHIGVLEVLEKEGIGVAGVVGTSMGSIIGAMYASGFSPEEMTRIVKELDLGAIITTKGKNYFTLSSRTGRDDNMIRPEIHMNSKNQAVGPLGLVPGTGVLQYIANELSEVTVTDFDLLPIPFACVATDLITGEKVVLRRGSLPSAVRASMSIPGVFDPWELDGRLLVDGGMVSNMPVETAKEIFPGYPVIAVNLTSELEPRENINGLMSVLNQSISILTGQNVQREAKLADLVINPDVKEYPMLGTTPADEIIEQGRAVATAMLPQIRELAQKAPRKPIARKPVPIEPPLVVEVKVMGVPEGMADEMERELSERWVGKKVSVPAILKASNWVSHREDVRNVDYDLQNVDGGVVVVMKVQRVAEQIFKFSGYGNTLSGMGHVKIEADRYDFFAPGDMLQGNFYLSDNWGADFNYFWDMNIDRSRFWEAGLTATRSRIKAEGNPSVHWQRYSFDLQRHFTLRDDLRLSIGAAAAAVRRVQNGDNFNYFAPFINWELNMMDDPDNPIEGVRASLRMAWFNDAEAMMMHANVMSRKQVSDTLLFEVDGGYTEGEDDGNPLYAAYLGGRNELYALSQRPLRSERFAWWRLKMCYPLTETMFGPVMAELFGGQGYAWNGDNSMFAEPWEVGLALVAPTRLIDGRVYAVYSDYHDEWKFGLSIGVPDWDVFQLF